MKGQIELNFEGGLLQQFPEFKDAVRASVYDCGKPLKVIAAEMDLSQSELSRKLNDNPNDPRNFTVRDLELFIPATGSFLIIDWLLAKFRQDDSLKRDYLLAEVNKRMTEFTAMMKALQA